MLQVCVRDRIILFDVTSETPQEIFFFNATSQFIDPNKYVESGIKIVECKEGDKNDYLITQIITNRNKDICFLSQDRQVFNRRYKFDQTPRNPICLGIFKKYAEIDLQELSRIQSKLTG